jgi:hypothetical protein
MKETLNKMIKLGNFVFGKVEMHEQIFIYFFKLIFVLKNLKLILVKSMVRLFG